MILGEVCLISTNESVNIRSGIIAVKRVCLSPFYALTEQSIRKRCVYASGITTLIALKRVSKHFDEFIYLKNKASTYTKIRLEF